MIVKQYLRKYHTLAWILRLSFLNWNKHRQDFEVKRNNFAIFQICYAIFISLIAYIYATYYLFHLHWISSIIMIILQIIVIQKHSKEELLVINAMEEFEEQIRVLNFNTRSLHFKIFHGFFMFCFATNPWLILFFELTLLLFYKEKYLMIGSYVCLRCFVNFATLIIYKIIMIDRVRAISESLNSRQDHEMLATNCLICLHQVTHDNYIRDHKNICDVHLIRFVKVTGPGL